jgi:hypothetical protein
MYSSYTKIYNQMMDQCHYSILQENNLSLHYKIFVSTPFFSEKQIVINSQTLLLSHIFVNIDSKKA